MTRVLLADDHGLVLSGLEALLSTEPDLNVVGTCVDGAEVIEFMARETPDVLVMDIDMPRLTGLEVMSRLAEEARLPPTIVIAATVQDWQVAEAAALGAWGVILKDQAPRMIIECIHSAMDGEVWTSSWKEAEASSQASVASPLTHREADIATRVARGASNKAIARHLEIAEGTVKVHLHRIYKKLGAGNRVQLALLFRQSR